MKVARVCTEGSQAVTIGLVDEASSEILDAGQVIRQLGLPLDASTAVELVRYNTETGGSLSSAVKDLSAFKVTRWSTSSVKWLAPIEAGSMKDFLAFEVHISNARSRNNLEIPPAWYESPVYYKGNHRTLIGHEEHAFRSRWTMSWSWRVSWARKGSTSRQSTPSHTSAAIA